MFYSSQLKANQSDYQKFLKIVGSLSNLFSDSEIPYLYYRVAEKIFCRAFEADDLSRSDVSADAKKDFTGIGLKTFLTGNNRTFQKIAEFNRDRDSYVNLSPKNLIRKISELRNARIQFTEDTFELNQSIYHCILRDSAIFKIFEEPMNKIDIENITGLKKNKNSIAFNDGIHEYSFLLSKSTLTKRFEINKTEFEFDVEIIKDPLTALQKLLIKKRMPLVEKKLQQTVFLPLYGRKQFVYERSGLNQWNAKGRPRDPNEVYIPIPSFIHRYFATFFPDRDTPFNLRLPSGKLLQSKVCQDNSKALMSYSNKELGKWILRKVLKLKEGELLTYNKLQKIGIDTVRIDKVDNNLFEINFSQIGTYDEFKEKNT